MGGLIALLLLAGLSDGALDAAPMHPRHKGSANVSITVDLSAPQPMSSILHG